MQVVDFEPIREVWSKYKLENDVILRNKFSLKTLLSIPTSDGQIAYNFELFLSTEVNIPPKEGIDLLVPHGPVQINPEDIDRELKFEIISNKPQIYETQKDTYIFVTEKLHKVYSTKKIDNLGRPAYQVEATGNVSFMHLKT